MEPFATRIREALAAGAGLPLEEIRLEQPRDLAHGDLAFPCFALAKARRQPPPKIAAELAAQVGPGLSGVTASAAGPYVNFQIAPAELARAVLGRIDAEGVRYGGSDEGRGRTVVVDLSSPNIAKPMSVGHLRSTVIGAALVRIHRALGYRAVGINHLGDWGSQFGKLVAAVDRWGATVDLESRPIHALLELYVRYHKEAEQDPSLEEAARAAFRELESGVDGPVRATWRRLRELSLRDFDRIYQRLGVGFDEIRGEAYYEPHLKPTLERVVASGITEISDGALVVDLTSIDPTMPPCLLQKTDGTTLYATRDLAALFHRHELYAFDRCLYVVGGEQRLHFRQLKGVLQRMGLDWEPRVEHVAFGLLRLPEGRMSTREGRVVFLDEVLDRAVDEARRIIREKNPGLASAETVAEQVGLGAIVFNDLKRERVKDVVFEWSEVLSFEGETGPYVQYTHARLASILRKAAEGAAPNAHGGTPAEPDWAVLAEARGVLLSLGRYPSVVSAAAAHAEPSEISQHLLGLCRELNTWYAGHRVLGEAAAVSAARLALVRAAKTVIHNALELLGAASPEEM